jgi:murein DD-endopeptidase MepM/ murein hydrolase activator NlpD
MLHLIHPALPRAAALDPLRLRQQSLGVAAVGIALALLISSSVSVSLARAAETAAQMATVQAFPATEDAAVSAPDAAAPEAAAAGSAPSTLAASSATSAIREEFTIDVRPPLVYPVGANAPVGSPFGPRDQACSACSTDHTGVDWNPGRGTPIVAIADGVVSKIGPAGSTLGVWVAIDHVVNGQEITSIYGHMEAGSMPYALGDRVRVGDVVGTVGSTGVTTAPHLHFELRIDGRAINPLPWLAANGAQ